MMANSRKMKASNVRIGDFIMTPDGTSGRVAGIMHISKSLADFHLADFHLADGKAASGIVTVTLLIAPGMDDLVHVSRP